MSYNEEEEDPYKILNVPHDATPSQIKSSYRKLALKHHPDKQSTEADRVAATQIFAKISGAYEILSDAKLKAEYDASQQQQQYQQQYGRRRRSHEEDVFSHPFFHQGGFHHFGGEGFMDPFELFNRVFAEELRAHNVNHAQSQRHYPQQQRQRDPFDDPFFSSGFGTFGGGMMGGGGAFGMMDQMMSSHHSMMNNMMNMSSSSQRMNGGMRQMMDMGSGGGSSMSFSSSFGGGGGGGVSESVSTSTRIINGRQQTVTERTVRRADGTVERHVETSGDDDFDQIGNGDGGGSSRRFLRY
mmetsp:Transcript_887/g.1414  ORF Transcript_887/g.1414 Transcript_887/m.1414 type:complete len:298 (+) Transcript_887:279-1172(+)